jgi:hypothetical protein
MSKVYSFRLDKNNPREAQAREVIEAWGKKGYSLRCFLTDVLVDFSRQEKKDDEMEILLSHLRSLIYKLDTETSIELENQAQSNLSASFLDALRKNAKTGVRAE